MRERERENYRLQSVLGSMMKPRETPQKPGKVAMAVALGPLVEMRPIMHLQTNLWSPIALRLTIASQHGVPGSGSGEPSAMKVEQVETSDVTVEHSMLAAPLPHTDIIITHINTPITTVDAFCLTISI